MYLGNFAVSGLVSCIWNSEGASGTPITMTTSGVVVILKHGTATRRSSTSGVTYSYNYGALPGVNYIAVDTSDNADANFYVGGKDYTVVVSGFNAGGITQSKAICSFSLANRSDLTETVETGYTASELIKLMAATLLGKVTISGGTVTFRDITDSKNRVVATVDANDQRIDPMTYDKS